MTTKEQRQFAAVAKLDAPLRIDVVNLDQAEAGRVAGAGELHRVGARREHREDGPTFASTRAGSLSLHDRADGLLLGAALSKRDQATVRAVEDVRAGRLTGLSVGMVVRRDDWGTATDGRTALRTIHAATLNEVSMVGRPANPQATILDVRHEQRGEAVEYRSLPLAFRDDRVGFTYVTCPNCGQNVPVTDDNLMADDDDDGRSGGTTKTDGRSLLAKNDSAALEAELWRALLS